MLVAVVALFIALGGIASAKAIGLIDGHNIKPGTVGHAQLAKGSVFSNNIAKGAVHSDNIAPSLLAHIMGNKSPSVGAAGGQGPQGPQGSKGDKGDRGDTGAPGHDGANPGAVVTQVPSIASSSGHNPNPDSGDPGQQGFYFTGTGTGGSASIAGGELILTGVGIDGNTEQGGIGIAKAFNVPLSSLDGVSWSYHILTPNGNNTPLVHVTVTGLNADSKFAQRLRQPRLRPGAQRRHCGAGPGLRRGCVPTGREVVQHDREHHQQPWGSERPAAALVLHRPQQRRDDRADQPRQRR